MFIASPGGLDAFRNRFDKTLAQYNRLEALPLGIYFEAVGWEHTLGGHTRAQEAINNELRGCDYALFMLRDRWGSPPDKNGIYDSGFAEEWAVAQDMLAAKTLFDHAVCFFPVPDEQLSDPGEQLKKVLTFKQKLVDGKAEFFRQFRADAEFSDWLRGHLAQWRRAHKGAAEPSRDAGLARLEAEPPTLPQSANLTASKAELNILKKLCTLLENKEFLAIPPFTLAVESLLSEPVNIAYAMLLRGYALGKRGRRAEEIVVYNDVIAHFSAATELPLRELVAWTLFVKGVTLGQLGNSTEAILTYDEVLARFGEATELPLREQVARAGQQGRRARRQRRSHSSLRRGACALWCSH